MAVEIRDYDDERDREVVVGLSLRPRMPVFASQEAVLGDELATRLHGEDWRVYRARSVRETLTSSANRSGIAHVNERTTGLVVATIVDADRHLGEIVMLAVDPAAQRQGNGRMLIDHATRWLRDGGMRVAMIGTGRDPGHAPARRVYEHAGYRLLPIARYFKAL